MRRLSQTTTVLSSPTPKPSPLCFTSFPPVSALLVMQSRFRTLIARYETPEKYFYAPNQFSIQKNHKVIIEALSLLVERGHDFHVVSTGRTADDRRPEYFPDLMREVERRNLTDRFHVLGVVPYADVTAFMRHCVAVVTTSLSEGWGFSVAEATLMGKSVILSDIAVFREQAPEFGVYFNPSNPQELAEHLAQAWRGYSVAIDFDRQKEAEKRRASAIVAFANEYENIVIETARRWRNRSGVKYGSSPEAGSAT